MTFTKYQELARRTQNKDLSMSKRMYHALHGLSAEVGEIHEIFQKSYQGHTVYTEKIIDEMSDVLWFIAELCDVFTVSMDELAQHNIDKLKKRFPDGFDPERSLHRED